MINKLDMVQITISKLVAESDSLLNWYWGFIFEGLDRSGGISCDADWRVNSELQCNINRVTLLLWLSSVTASGLRDLWKEAISDYRGLICVDALDAVSCLCRRPGHTWCRNAQMPRVVLNLPEWLASRWHPYATLISALQTAAGDKDSVWRLLFMLSAFIWASKCRREELDAFPLLWYSLAFWMKKKKTKQEVTHLEASENGGFRGNFLVLFPANEINAFCQSEVSRFNVGLNYTWLMETVILWRELHLASSCFWRGLHSSVRLLSKLQFLPFTQLCLQQTTTTSVLHNLYWQQFSFNFRPNRLALRGGSVLKGYGAFRWHLKWCIA